MKDERHRKMIAGPVKSTLVDNLNQIGLNYEPCSNIKADHDRYYFEVIGKDFLLKLKKLAEQDVKTKPGK